MLRLKQLQLAPHQFLVQQLLAHQEPLEQLRVLQQAHHNQHRLVPQQHLVQLVLRLKQLQLAPHQFLVQQLLAHQEPLEQLRVLQQAHHHQHRLVPQQHLVQLVLRLKQLQLAPHQFLVQQLLAHQEPLEQLRVLQQAHHHQHRLVPQQHLVQLVLRLKQLQLAPHQFLVQQLLAHQEPLEQLRVLQQAHHHQHRLVPQQHLVQLVLRLKQLQLAPHQFLVQQLQAHQEPLEQLRVLQQAHHHQHRLVPQQHLVQLVLHLKQLQLASHQFLVQQLLAHQEPLEQLRVLQQAHHHQHRLVPQQHLVQLVLRLKQLQLAPHQFLVQQLLAHQEPLEQLRVLQQAHHHQHRLVPQQHLVQLVLRLKQLQLAPHQFLVQQLLAHQEPLEQLRVLQQAHHHQHRLVPQQHLVQLVLRLKQLQLAPHQFLVQQLLAHQEPLEQLRVLQQAHHHQHRLVPQQHLVQLVLRLKQLQLAPHQFLVQQLLAHQEPLEQLRVLQQAHHHQHRLVPQQHLVQLVLRLKQLQLAPHQFLVQQLLAHQEPLEQLRVLQQAHHHQHRLVPQQHLVQLVLRLKQLQLAPHQFLVQQLLAHQEPLEQLRVLQQAHHHQHRLVPQQHLVQLVLRLKQLQLAPHQFPQQQLLAHQEPLEQLRVLQQAHHHQHRLVPQQHLVQLVLRLKQLQLAPHQFLVQQLLAHQEPLEQLRVLQQAHHHQHRLVPQQHLVQLVLRLKQLQLAPHQFLVQQLLAHQEPLEQLRVLQQAHHHQHRLVPQQHLVQLVLRLKQLQLAPHQFLVQQLLAHQEPLEQLRVLQQAHHHQHRLVPQQHLVQLVLRLKQLQLAPHQFLVQQLLAHQEPLEQLRVLQQAHHHQHRLVPQQHLVQLVLRLKQLQLAPHQFLVQQLLAHQEPLEQLRVLQQAHHHQHRLTSTTSGTTTPVSGTTTSGTSGTTGTTTSATTSTPPPTPTGTSIWYN